MIAAICVECEETIIGKIHANFNDESTCSICFERAGLTTCPRCKETVSRDTLFRKDLITNPDGVDWCVGCMATECFRCACCNDYAWKRDCIEVLTGSSLRVGSTENICKHCSNRTVICEDCGNRIYTSNAYNNDGGYDICQSCYLDHYVVCEECGDVVRVEDSRALGDDYYCNDCRPYGEDFSPCGFRNDSGCTIEIGSARCFGVELETDECIGYTKLEGTLAWGAKNDCTVSGKEFYSDILSGDEGLEAIREWGELANQHKWCAGYDAGYHLHLDMRNESTNSLYAIAYAYRATQNVWLSFVPQHRRMNSYSHMIQWSCADLDSMMRQKYSFYRFSGTGTRFNWCNLVAYQQHTTIEIRLHHGTCDTAAVINWIKAHTRFADWAAKLGYEGVKKALNGLDCDEKFILIAQEIWKDKDLLAYYAKEVKCHTCTKSISNFPF